MLCAAIPGQVGRDPAVRRLNLVRSSVSPVRTVSATGGRSGPVTRRARPSHPRRRRGPGGRNIRRPGRRRDCRPGTMARPDASSAETASSRCRPRSVPPRRRKRGPPQARRRHVSSVRFVIRSAGAPLRSRRAPGGNASRGGRVQDAEAERAAPLSQRCEVDAGDAGAPSGTPPLLEVES